MKFVVFVHADQRTEDGQLPTEAELAEMGEFNEQLVDAGMMLAGEGLHPTSRGARIDYGDDSAEISDGPFADSGATVAGFWMLEAESLDEVKRWMLRAPFRQASIEIRQVFSDDDFGEEFTPELREREAELRRRVADQQAD